MTAASYEFRVRVLGPLGEDGAERVYGGERRCHDDRGGRTAGALPAPSRAHPNASNASGRMTIGRSGPFDPPAKGR